MTIKSAAVALSAVLVLAAYACVGEDDDQIDDDLVEEAESEVVSTSGLVGEWKLNETSGTTAADTSPTPASGALSGGPAWTTGKVAGALNFDGADDHVNVGNPTKLRLTGAMTLAAWVRIDTFTDNGRIITKRGSSNAAGWSLGVESGGYGAFQIASNSTTLLTANTTALPTGTWVHLAGVYQPGVALRVYVNGALNASVTTSIPATQYNAVNNVNIGRKPNGYNFFDGRIDQVRVYNRALTAAEITGLHTEGNVTPPPPPPPPPAPFATLPLPPGGADRYTIGGWNRLFHMAVPGNLDGDAVLDWIAKSDPQESQTGTVMLEARKTNGALLWEYDTKITAAYTQDRNGLHEGVLPWDLDGDGRDEVVTVRLDANLKPWVVALDGATGLVKSQILLPPGGGKSGGGTENLGNGIGNHYMTIAYLDGATGGPSVIVTQGIYQSGAVWAFRWSGGLQHRWTYQHPAGMGTSAHEVVAYDLDGDKKEEVLFGGTVLRPDGTKIWSLNSYGWGHVDVVVPGDLDPNHPGKEIFFTVEIPNASGPAVMTDAMTGTILWQKNGAHVHQGWAANIDASRPGDECRARDKIAIDQIANGQPVTGLDGTWTASGSALSIKPDMHRPPEWTGDAVYDLSPQLDGFDYAADLGGGTNHGAEELILLPDYDAVAPFTITVRFNLSANSYPSRWANRHYRQDVTHVGAGYGSSRATFRVVP